MPLWLEITRLVFLVSIPQTFALLTFCFSFLHVPPKNLQRRLLLYTVVHSVYVDILYYIVPVPVHMLNSICASIILCFIMFRDLKAKQIFSLLLFSFILGSIMDLILGILSFYALNIPDQKTMMSTSFYQMLIALYPELLILWLWSWMIRKKDSLSFKRLFAAVMNSERADLTKLITMNGVQSVAIGTVLFLLSIGNENKYGYITIISIFVMIISLLALAFTIFLVVRTQERAVRMTQDIYLGDIDQMFASIRGQRHDFLNHVQVIHTMAQMRKIDQLQQYLGELVKESQGISEIVNHSSPVLAAFIKAKITVAISKSIAFTYELPNRWDSSDTSVKTIDIVKILGNLVDNAFDEVASLPQIERIVHVIVRHEEDGLTLEIRNKGRVLNDSELARIFLPGYTTKRAGHSGLGLAIVLERVGSYNGKLDVRSNEKEGTVFRIVLPQQEALAVKSYG
ncbi:GHKL domain-containing protein [Cohnella faecalis]|uniref:histidine kinase n=2 Tax=Cohnella faecalis TaxID=2315694 RepID=A0A398CPF0_9BACL|nr:GHKL domain-containing protein [Cohnella faecalis]